MHLVIHKILEATCFLLHRNSEVDTGAGIPLFRAGFNIINEKPPCYTYSHLSCYTALVYQLNSSARWGTQQNLCSWPYSYSNFCTISSSIFSYHTCSSLFHPFFPISDHCPDYVLKDKNQIKVKNMTWLWQNSLRKFDFSYIRLVTAKQLR